MRYPSGAARSPPSSTRSPVLSKRSGTLQQLSCWLMTTLFLVTMCSITFVLLRKDVVEPGGALPRTRVLPLTISEEAQSDDNLAAMFHTRARAASFNASVAAYPKVLILTPVKNSARHLGRFFKNIRSLSYPHERLSIGLLESDSDDVIPTDLLLQLKALASSNPGVPALDAMLRAHEARMQPKSAFATLKDAALAVVNTSRGPETHPAHVHGLSLAQSTRLSGTLALILAEAPALLAEFGRVAVFQASLYSSWRVTTMPSRMSLFR